MSEPDITEIESPCIKVCAVDKQDGICIGCGRSLSEIAEWTGYAPETRRRLMTELSERLAARRIVADHLRF